LEMLLGILCVAGALVSPRMSSAQLRAQVADTKERASKAIPFCDTELDGTIAGLQSLAGATGASLDWSALRELLRDRCHLSHKEWSVTEMSASKLESLVGTPDDKAFQAIFKRVLHDGNWQGAAEAGASRPAKTKPWVVLVSGLNGIRKTTSVHQPWFQSCLEQALKGQYDGERGALPDGANSFFRQLDYMLTTIAVKDFEKLFEITDVGLYAEVKQSIFGRYRTAAEMLGVLLVKEAKKKGSNLMVETSGRDIGMYTYIDHLFPGDEYNKLVCHFSINDLAFAERSVDTRMRNEMREGKDALAAQPAAGLAAIVQANAGGPYGSQVLKGVKEDSDAVWAKLQSSDSDVAASWFKATIAINASDDRDWTACALIDGKPEGEAFVFEKR